MYDYILLMCLVPMEARKGAGSPGTEVQMVITTMWLLGTKPRSSAETTRTAPLSYHSNHEANYAFKTLDPVVKSSLV